MDGDACETVKIIKQDEYYPVLALQYAKHPRQHTTPTVRGTTIRRVLPRLELAELAAGLKVEGCRVVEVCFSILGGGLPIQINV